MPSARQNNSNNGVFISGIANGVLNSGQADQAPLREMQLNDLQKSGELGQAKMDRQNSFVLYGKQRAQNMSMTVHSGHNGSKLAHSGSNGTHHFGGTKLDSKRGDHVMAETFHAREPNETSIMKARPSTTIRMATKSHSFSSCSAAAGLQHHHQMASSGGNFKFGGRQILNQQ